LRMFILEAKITQASSESSTYYMLLEGHFANYL